MLKSSLARPILCSELIIIRLNRHSHRLLQVEYLSAFFSVKFLKREIRVITIDLDHFAVLLLL